MEIKHTAEHWSQTCQALIPEAYDVIDSNGFVIGSGWTLEEAAQLMIQAKNEGRN